MVEWVLVFKIFYTTHWFTFCSRTLIFSYFCRQIFFIDETIGFMAPTIPEGFSAANISIIFDICKL